MAGQTVCCGALSLSLTRVTVRLFSGVVRYCQVLTCIVRARGARGWFIIPHLKVIALCRGHQPSRYLRASAFGCKKGTSPHRAQILVSMHRAFSNTCSGLVTACAKLFVAGGSMPSGSKPLGRDVSRRVRAAASAGDAHRANVCSPAGPPPRCLQSARAARACARLLELRMGASSNTIDACVGRGGRLKPPTARNPLTRADIEARSRSLHASVACGHPTPRQRIYRDYHASSPGPGNLAA